MNTRTMVGISSDIDCDGVGYGYHRFEAPADLVEEFVIVKELRHAIMEHNKARTEAFKLLMQEGDGDKWVEDMKRHDAMCPPIEPASTHRYYHELAARIVDYGRDNGARLEHVSSVMTEEEWKENSWEKLGSWEKKYWEEEGYLGEFVPR